MPDDFSPEFNLAESQTELPLGEGETHQPEPQIPPEPADNAERSQLGRRLKRVEESLGTLSSLQTKLDKIAELMEPRAAGYDSFTTPPGTGPSEEMPQYINTPEDFERYERIKRQKEEAVYERYRQGYVGTVKARGLRDPSTPPDLHAEIEKELLVTGVNNPKYARHTGHPMRDAEINYGLAKAEVLSRRYAQDSTRPNVRGDRANPPSGVTAATRVAGSPAQKVELDEYARKFVSAIGKSPEDEWVQNSLKKK